MEIADYHIYRYFYIVFGTASNYNVIFKVLRVRSVSIPIAPMQTRPRSVKSDCLYIDVVVVAVIFNFGPIVVLCVC